MLNSRTLLNSTHRRRKMVNSRSLGEAPYSIRAWLIASSPRFMSIDGYRLSTSADRRAQLLGYSALLRCLATHALFIMYDSRRNMMGLSNMSNSTDTAYVIQPILAQMGRIGGVRPGTNGGFIGNGMSSFCN